MEIKKYDGFIRRHDSALLTECEKVRNTPNKKKLFLNMFSRYCNDHRKVWENGKTLTRRNERSILLDEININGEKLTEARMANARNNFFINTGQHPDTTDHSAGFVTNSKIIGPPSF